MEFKLKSEHSVCEAQDAYQLTLPVEFSKSEQYLKSHAIRTVSRIYTSRSIFSSFAFMLPLLLFIASNAVAEAQKGESRDSIVSGSYAAGSLVSQQRNQSCRVDDPVDTGSKQQKGEEIQSPYWAYRVSERDERCFANPETLRREWRTGAITLVDVRSSQAFRKGFVPGSINIPEYSIRTKRFLKQKRLVLMNDGISNQSLIHTCQRLRKSGFRNVSVLPGGIFAWLKMDIPIERRLTGSLDSVLSPRDLVRSLPEIAWLFLADAADIDAVKQVLHSGDVLPMASSREEIVERLEKIAELASPKIPVRIAIVADGSITQESIKFFRGMRIPNPVFILKGGLLGYKQYAASHALQIAKIERGPYVHRGCSS